MIFAGGPPGSGKRRWLWPWRRRGELVLDPVAAREALLKMFDEGRRVAQMVDDLSRLSQTGVNDGTRFAMVWKLGKAKEAWELGLLAAMGDFVEATPLEELTGWFGLNADLDVLIGDRLSRT